MNIGISKLGELSELTSEFEGAEFGDERLTRRLRGTVSRLSQGPASGFPQLLGSGADLEGWYRFLRNPRVNPTSILSPHIKATCARVADHGESLVIHDTSTFCFFGDSRRRGLYRVTKEKQGFLGHFALAASLGEVATPLGVLGMETYVRRDKGTGTRLSGIRPKKEQSERQRWNRLVENVESLVGESASLIHVMDREADGYEELAYLITTGKRFVIRGHFNRRLQDGSRLFDTMENAPVLACRQVRLGKRKEREFPDHRKTYPARASREAKVQISAASIYLPRPTSSPKAISASISMNVVRVREIGHSETLTPLEWFIFTTEPVGTAEDVLRIVDIYKKRWLIEDYFKALKTGCAFEKRQLESKETLLNALAALIPMAWKLLLLRSVAHEASEDDATLLLSKDQLTMLRRCSKKQLPPKINLRALMFAVAAIGGHIPNNGEPGWQVLGRGLEKLLLYELGWKDAMDAAKRGCDQ